MSETKVSFSTKEQDRAYLDDPKQPDLAGKMPRIKARGSQLVEGVRFFSPSLPLGQVQILGVGIAPTPEEASSVLVGSYAEHQVQPRLMKGPCGTIITDCMNKFSHLFSDHFAYTVLTPWLLPKSRRFKPKKEEIAWAAPALEELIQKTKPRCILAFGKLAFEQLVDMKISADDARYGWFSYKDTGIPVYLLDPITLLLTQPWTIDTLITDFREVNRMMINRHGDPPPEIPTNYIEIKTMEQLESMVKFWEICGYDRFSVDCEWAGANYVDGRLRSIQFCWEPGTACYLNFFDENGTCHLGKKVRPIGPSETLDDLSLPEGSRLAINSDIGVTVGNPQGVVKVGFEIVEEAPGATTMEAIGACKQGAPIFDTEALSAVREFYCEPGLSRSIMPFEKVEPIGSDQKVLIHPNQRVAPGEAYTDYEAVGKVLGRYLNQPHIKYLGHHFSADSPWMETWLGLDVLGKCCFDLEFAKQTCNEYARYGLEVMALEYTNFGRYDMPLVLWKRENKKLMAEDEGYGKVPDEILVPYAIKDVDVVLRCYPHLIQDLERQGIRGYYESMILPFVTDTFHTFITTGLPVDMKLFELTRRFFNWAYRALLLDFRNFLAEQANEKVAAFIGCGMDFVKEQAARRDKGEVTAAVNTIKSVASDIPDYLVHHWENIRNFNIRSTDDMRRWLFQVLGLTPVKTTKNANNGMPSMMWDRVLELPEKLQKTLQPAVDKETIEILSAVDDTGSLNRLLAVSNVGNQCKGFLKEGEYDEDGELIEENGLAKFITSREFLIFNLSLTDTSRPRSWRPNVLNLSKYHNKGVENGLIRVLENKDNNPFFVLPEEFDVLFGGEEQRRTRTAKDMIKKDMPSIRSTVCAKPGGCFVESDYKTAELRIQGFASGDRALIKLLTEPDPAFGLVKIKDTTKTVRLFYPEGSGIYPENQNESFIMAICEEDKAPVKVTEDMLIRDSDGAIEHPGYDLHWSLAELCQHKPREAMNNDRDRGAAKQANFSGAYGSVGTTLERRIEAVTGIKPEPGTGDALLEALRERQTVSVEFLDALGQAPKKGEPLRAASGRLRRFPIHSSELQGMPWRIRNSYLRSMGNEAKNFPFQESVASTAARACRMLNNFFRNHGMKARTAIALYDAILTYCPDASERFVVAEAHQLFMCDINVWHYHGRWMNYPIDTDLCFRWSWKPKDDERKMLHSKEWMPMDPAKEKLLLDALSKVREDFFSFQPDILPVLNKA